MAWNISLALTLLIACLASSLHAAESKPGDMIVIPAGPFTMGYDSGLGDERPAHQVHLAAYKIDRTPVTNAQFAAFLETTGPVDTHGRRLFDFDDADARIHRADGRWVADQGFENHPVVEPSWFGAHAYCAWLGQRLPTEAEWEKAARGTDGRRYPWGRQAPDKTRAQFDAGWNETVPVGSFIVGASPYGVLDLAGNVWEWVSSVYAPYPYDARDGREDPMIERVRGTRGGGHDSPAGEITTTQRGRDLSRNYRVGHHNIGFRCAADVN